MTQCAKYSERYGGDWVGIEAIRKDFAVVFSAREPYDTLHVVTNPMIELLDADTATGVGI